MENISFLDYFIVYLFFIFVTSYTFFEFFYEEYWKENFNIKEYYFYKGKLTKLGYIFKLILLFFGYIIFNIKYTIKKKLTNV